MIRALVTISAVLLSTSAWAEFYIQHKPEMTVCTITETKPNGTDEIQLGEAWKTKEEAETAMKNSSYCQQP